MTLRTAVELTSITMVVVAMAMYIYHKRKYPRPPVAKDPGDA